jgi:thymidylate synthase (FAD)
MTKQDQIKNDNRYIPVHEFGFVGLIETMGSDQSICDAARVSYGAGTKSVSDDRNLIRYLMRHKHTSPFEMAEVKFHIKMPIMVMRQLIRHRTANVNEYSGRYSEMSDEFYIPADDYIEAQSKTNKQGREGVITQKDKGIVRLLFQKAYNHVHKIYKRLLGEDNGYFEGVPFFDEEFPGIARELARLPLSVANYTECYWKIDLHNFFHMARLRLDKHAQREIRDFAQAMYDLAKPHFPMAFDAFDDYVRFARTLSRMDIVAVRDMLAGTFVPDPNHYGMSKREYTELIEFFGPNEDGSWQRSRT